MPLPTSTFSRRVVKLALSIPKGRVTTYGYLARAAGSGGMAAQSIGSILSRAEEQGVTGIPWHRIVYADGRAWLRDDIRQERLELYRQEGIEIDRRGKIVNFKTIVLDLFWPNFDDLDGDAML